jgi:hypothetical protein
MKELFIVITHVAEYFPSKDTNGSFNPA